MDIILTAELAIFVVHGESRLTHDAFKFYTRSESSEGYTNAIVVDSVCELMCVVKLDVMQS
jgi:hypothetical protein